MAAGLKNVLRLLRLLLAECAESFRLLLVEGSVAAETGTLEALEARIVSCWLRLRLRLLLLEATISKTVLIAGWLRLQAKSWILLLLRINHISKPIHGWLLLVTLIPASGLRNSWLRRCWRSIEEQIRICVFQFPSTKFFLFLAEFDGFGQVRVFFRIILGFGTPLRLFFSLGFTRFDSKTIFEVIIIVAVVVALSLAWSRGRIAAVTRRTKVIETSDS